MPSLQPIVGRTFGNLTVLARSGVVHGQTGWLCRCTCGVEIVAGRWKLTAGKKKSCSVNGHLFHAVPPGTLTAHTHPREHRSWRAAHDRCLGRNPSDAKYYRDRGITVCERWKLFANFYEDMGPRPPGHTLDRIDVNAGYSKENCRWATDAQQRRNMTCSFFVEHEGHRRLLQDICRDRGLARSVVYGRLQNGWSLPRALREPTRKKRSIAEIIANAPPPDFELVVNNPPEHVLPTYDAPCYRPALLRAIEAAQEQAKTEDGVEHV